MSRRAEEAVRAAGCQGNDTSATPRAPLTLAAKLVRLMARHPRVVPVLAAWAARTVRRVGVRVLLRDRPRPVTFGVRQFMDAVDVAPAWELMQQGVTRDDPRLAVALSGPPFDGQPRRGSEEALERGGVEHGHQWRAQPISPPGSGPFRGRSVGFGWFC